MMKQYLEIKEQHQSYVLFFRLGDFYEMFFDDAVEVSRFLDLTLTARGQKENRIPMCGIPYHAAEGYIARLIKGGYRIAVCEQVENPSEAKGIVRREVVKYYTPGTILSDHILEGKASNYIAAIAKLKQGYGLAFADLSTGEFMSTQFERESELLSEIVRKSPAEIVYSSKDVPPAGLSEWVEKERHLLSPFDDWVFSLQESEQKLKDQYGLHSLDGLGFKDAPVAVAAAGGLLGYLRQMHGDRLGHLKVVQPYVTTETMILDLSTQKNLELLTSLSGHPKGTLLAVIDQTLTSAGGRLLKKWMLHPLRNLEQLNKRHEAVQEWFDQDAARQQMQGALANIQDLERLIGRINSGIGNGRDLLALSRSLKQIPEIKGLVEQGQSALCQTLANQLSPLLSVQNKIDQAIVDEPPVSVREGGFIRSGYHPDLDELHHLKNDGKAWLKTLQEQEIKRTGIKSLKVKYNKVFGYYIEITKSNLQDVPENYIRKQTLVNAERFITPELKEKEALILGADDRISQMEFQLFEQLVQDIVQETSAIQANAEALAILDVVQSFAQVSKSNQYIRPQMEQSTRLILKNGRHPVVEQLLVKERFVPNDTHMSTDQNQVMMITGPNMAGKSTYIRQVALIAYMAQIGLFVPAEEAVIGLVDRIFTRVGAADELARGQSTFMLEMNETSNILHNATEKSLVILDEVGRGTSTFDGVSIAWAIVEYVHNVLGAKTIFATHYHELTHLASELERVGNFNVACQESKDNVVFLHKIVSGGTDKSYGIHVAKLAGLPSSVIQRAKQILKGLESPQLDLPLVDSYAQPLALEETLPEEGPYGDIIEELKELNVSELTPVQALMLLDQWVQKVQTVGSV